MTLHDAFASRLFEATRNVGQVLQFAATVSFVGVFGPWRTSHALVRLHVLLLTPRKTKNTPTQSCLDGLNNPRYNEGNASFGSKTGEEL